MSDVSSQIGISDASKVDHTHARNLAYGYTLALFAVTLFSLSALFIILVSDSGVEDWTIIFLQMVFTSAVGFIYTATVSESLWDYYSKFRNLGLLGTLASLLLAVEGIAFIFAVLYTNVANVYIILVCNPLISSVLSSVVFGETIPWRTIITILVCVTTIATVVGLEMADDLDSSWFGNVMAATATFTLASYIVTMRGANKYRNPE
jgi:drug/metabolite transporter (DMT)-like permease